MGNFSIVYKIKVTVCVRVLFIGGHTVGPTELKFGMEDHIYHWEVIGYISFQYLYPQGRGRLKSGSGGPCWAPCNWGDGSGQTSSRCTAAGPIGPIVPLPFRLKFGREMGTYPGRSVPMFWLGSGAQIMGFQGTIWPNYEWFARVWMLQLAGALPLAQAL